MDALKIIAESSMKKEVPSFSIGDTVRVGVRIREGKTERIQMFEGTVIAVKGSGVSKTFTVRRFLRCWCRACIPASFRQR
mgnify:CR=1 FL=1